MVQLRLKYRRCATEVSVPFRFRSVHLISLRMAERQLSIANVGRIFTKVKGHLSVSKQNMALNKLLPEKERVEFDQVLYHFAFISDRMENLRIFTGRRNRLSFSKRVHNFGVWFILFAYFLRSMACFFTNDKRKLMYLGDISPYMGGFRMMFLIPVACWSFYALALNTLFTFHKHSTEWLYPFGFTKGLVTPSDAGLQEQRQLKKLLFRIKLTAAAINGMILSAAVLAGLLFMTIPLYKYENRSDAYKYGIPWGLLQGIWTYFCAGNICGNFGYFHVLCYYLMLRFKKVNKRAKFLVANHLAITPLKMHKSLLDIVSEHNAIAIDVAKYNRFWSIYAAINYFTFIPLICFVVYITIFGNIEIMVFTTFAVLSLDCGSILGSVILSGAMVTTEVRKI